MQRKLTITLDEQLYKMLHHKIGAGRISRFIAETISPILKSNDSLYKGYKKMAIDEKRQKKANTWIESSVDECLPDDDLENWSGLQ